MIIMFPCLNDNYGFLLHDPSTGLTAAIDTPDGKEISRQCELHNFTLSHIFNTHHHFDHIGGNAFLKERYNISIIGPKEDKERIPHIDVSVIDNEVFMFGKFEIHVLHTPGHTKGHCAYYIPSLESIFVGDTLFALGCGRLFEGTPEQMFQSILNITALPDNTKIYCAHEYTLANGAFAASVDPENINLQKYLHHAKALRAQNTPTIPTTIAKEKLANPFVRVKTANEFAQLRAAKDTF